jgi:hypothetical protein
VNALFLDPQMPLFARAHGPARDRAYANDHLKIQTSAETSFFPVKKDLSKSNASLATCIRHYKAHR